MAAVPGVTRRLRDVVRDSKIRKDIPSNLHYNFDSFASEIDRGFGEVRHHWKQNSDRVERDLPRRPPAWDCEGEQPCRKHIGFISSNDEVERWFLDYMKKEAPLLGVYRKNTESESIILRFKRNLSSFDGFWDTDALLRWIVDIEDFFAEVRPPRHLKCKIVWFKMVGKAYYWWKLFQQGRIEHGEEEIVSWSMMKKLLISRFVPARCSTKVPNQLNKPENSKEVKHTDNSATCLLEAHSNCSLEEVKGSNIGGVECSQGDVCNEPDNMPTSEVIVSEINVKHEEEREEASQEIKGQVLPIGEGKKDDGVIHENDIGGSIKEDDLSKVMTDMDMLKYALMKEISVKGQEPQAKHGVHSNHWSNTSRIGNGIGAKVQRVEKEQNRKQACWCPSGVGSIVDEMLTFSFDPGGVTKRGDAFTLLISKATIADLSSNKALKKKMIVTHDMEAILKLIRHMNMINGEYSPYTNAIFKFATILFDPGGVLFPLQTTSLSNDFKADHAMPKLCDWIFDMVKGILVGIMVNDGLCISGLIKIEAKVVGLAHVAKFRDPMKQEWVNAFQGPKWLVCYVMAILESNTTHITVGQGQSGLVIIMEHDQCDMLDTKMESFALKLICKHTYCSCVTIPMDRSVTTGVDAYLTPFLKRYLYELVFKLHSNLVLCYPHIMVKAEMAMRIVLCLCSWLANRHDGLVCFMVVNLLNSQARINVRTLNDCSFSCSVDTRVTRLYCSQWYTCRGGVCLNEFSANVKQSNMVVLLPLSHTSGTHITFADVPFLATNVFPNVFVCSLHLNRVIYEHFGQPLFIVESMYYVQVSVDVSSHVLSNFDIETPDRKVFTPIIVVIDMRAKTTMQALSIYCRSSIGFRYSTPILEFLVLELSLFVMVLCLELCLWMDGQILAGYAMSCLTGSSWLHGNYKDNILPILIRRLRLYQSQTNGGDPMSYEHDSEMLRGLSATLQFLWNGLRREDLSTYPDVDLSRELVMSWESWKDENGTDMKKDFTIGKRGINILTETFVCLYSLALDMQMSALKLGFGCIIWPCLCVAKPIFRFVPTGVDAYLTPFIKEYLYGTAMSLYHSGEVLGNENDTLLVLLFGPISVAASTVLLGTMTFTSHDRSKHIVYDRELQQATLVYIQLMSHGHWGYDFCLTRGRVMSHLGVSSCLKILCRKGQFKLLKLFYKVVNGLDPPTSLGTVPYEFARDELFVGRDRDDVMRCKFTVFIWWGYFCLFRMFIGDSI